MIPRMMEGPKPDWLRALIVYIATVHRTNLFLKQNIYKSQILSYKNHDCVYIVFIYPDTQSKLRHPIYHKPAFVIRILNVLPVFLQVLHLFSPMAQNRFMPFLKKRAIQTI